MRISHMLSIVALFSGCAYNGLSHTQTEGEKNHARHLAFVRQDSIKAKEELVKTMAQAQRNREDSIWVQAYNDSLLQLPDSPSAFGIALGSIIPQNVGPHKYKWEAGIFASYIDSFPTWARIAVQSCHNWIWLNRRTMVPEILTKGMSFTLNAQVDQDGKIMRIRARATALHSIISLPGNSSVACERYNLVLSTLNSKYHLIKGPAQDDSSEYGAKHNIKNGTSHYTSIKSLFKGKGLLIETYRNKFDIILDYVAPDLYKKWIETVVRNETAKRDSLEAKPRNGL